MTLQEKYDWYGQYVPGYKSAATDTTAQSSTGSLTGPTVSGQLTGVSSKEGSDAYGYKSLVPDPSASQTAANRANQYNLADLTGLASQVNTFNQNQLLNQITSLYPQFTSTVSQLGGNISDWAQGNVSQSTVNQLAQTAAQRGAAGGLSSESPSTNAALMNLLGTTSEGLQSKALSGYSTLMNAIPTTKAWDFTSQFVTPSTEYNAQLLSNIYQSAANPATAAETSLENTLSGLSSGYWNTGGGTSGSNNYLTSLLSGLTSGGSKSTSAAGSSSKSDSSYADRLSAYNNYWSGLTGAGSSSGGAISGYTDALDAAYESWLGGGWSE